MTRFVRLYLKWFVKTHILYVLVIVIGLSSFVCLAVNTKVAVIETFEGIYADDRLIINQVVDYPIAKAYAYQDRSDKVTSYTVLSIEHIDDSYTVLFIDKSKEQEPFEGVISVDVEKEYVCLLDVVLGLKKRYVEKGTK